MICPACSAENAREVSLASQPYVRFHRCKSCGCRFGTLRSGDSFSVVNRQLTGDPDKIAREVPFDFTILASDGVKRLHGFFDPRSGYVTQWG